MVRPIVLLLSAISLAAGSAAPARAADAERVVVRFSGSASPNERAAARRQAGASAARSVPALAGVQVVQVPAGRAARAAAQLQRSGDVLWAEPDQRVRVAMALPADGGSSSGGQWGLLNSGQWIFGRYGLAGIDGDFTRAWDMTLGARSQPIAVVDTGVDFSIRDLSANAAGHDHDWIDGDDNAAPGPAGAQLPTDASHGTHVAGIAAAALGVNQSAGDITGGAPGAGITALRVLDTDGYGWSSDIAAAFAWAAEHGARVVNASLSGIGPSPAMADAIASHPQTLFVVAAGNGGSDGVGDDEDARGPDERDYPCANPAPNVVCVAAIDNRGALARFSNYGAASVDVGAAGVDVLSYVRGGSVQYWDGTSMATPYAAAAAALGFAAHPEASAAQVRAAMLAGARPLPSLAGRTVSGGMVDAAALLERLGSTAPPALRTAVSLPSGSPLVDRPLTAGGGAFDAGSVDWSWQRCDAGCTVIAGAQQATYVPTAADVGHRLRAIATATTAGGSVSSQSGLSDPVVVAAAQAAPVPPPPAAVATPAPAAPAKPHTLRPGLSHRWLRSGSRFTLRRLRVSHLPHGATVRIGCSGRGCPVRSLRVKASGSSLDLLRALGRRTRFRSGQTLELRVWAPGYTTAVVRFALQRGRSPRALVTAAAR